MSLKEIHIRYKEAKNCGYPGTFADYVIKIGVNLNELKPEEKRK